MDLFLLLGFLFFELCLSLLLLLLSELLLLFFLLFLVKLGLGFLGELGGLRLLDLLLIGLIVRRIGLVL